ncbi:hypothetical protein PHYPSEUDO_015305 [Phytophthora pseudosyringae]|uniref:Glutaredoxin domain-containing protein n=1 Tax=Phytophthora pseudosyringae TaxID=221518 RepID=A0A8T1V3B6_9STRA|nr:hypothetical protein PHYPSEUDO_015305 [Phytophthora pseudosyringae]
MVSAKESVAAQIAASPVVVYSKSYCPYCTKTKTLLTELGAKFEVVELSHVDGGNASYSMTVSKVFVGSGSTRQLAVATTDKPL